MARLFSLLAGMVFLIGFTQDLESQEKFRVSPGDVLAIEVLEDPSLNRDVLVLPDGQFSFPFAGTVRAGGRTLTQVEEDLKTAISGNFALPPSVFVSVRNIQPRSSPQILTPTEEMEESVNIYFIGEVNTPGLRSLAQGTTFLQAVAANGGFTNFAALKRIQLRSKDPRTGRQVTIKLNYKALAAGAEILYDPVLRDGDIIVVPERRLFE